MNFTVKKFEELDPKELYEILKARQRVFMLEQKISCLDMDDVDYQSIHVFAMEEGSVVANLRAYPLEREGEARIGRVLTLSRGKGYGRALMDAAISAVKEKLGARYLFVDAQVQARPYYEKCGFLPVSEEFLEEGIPHIKMKMELSDF